MLLVAHLGAWALGSDLSPAINPRGWQAAQSVEESRRAQHTAFPQPSTPDPDTRAALPAPKQTVAAAEQVWLVCASYLLVLVLGFAAGYLTSRLRQRAWPHKTAAETSTVLHSPALVATQAAVVLEGKTAVAVAAAPLASSSSSSSSAADDQSPMGADAAAAALPPAGATDSSPGRLPAEQAVLSCTGSRAIKEGAELASSQSPVTVEEPQTPRPSSTGVRVFENVRAFPATVIPRISSKHLPFNNRHAPAVKALILVCGRSRAGCKLGSAAAITPGPGFGPRMGGHGRAGLGWPAAVSRARGPGRPPGSAAGPAA